MINVMELVGVGLDEAIAKYIFDGIPPRGEYLPRYSEHIEEAWEVINRMMAYHHSRPRIFRTAGNEWLVRMDHNEPEGYGSTVQLAICRAALLSVLKE